MNAIAEARPRLGAVQVGAILMALVTAGIHLYYTIFVEDPATPGFWLFLGNVIGYVVWPSALYLVSNPLVERFRRAMRTVLIAQATTSLISFFYVYLVVLGTSFDRVGLVAKAAEILLILLLTIDAATNNRDGEERSVGSAVVQLVVGLLLGVGLFVATIPWISDNSWDYLFLGFQTILGK